MLKIFQLLPPQDLKMVVLVCKRWRDMGEDPSLWTWCLVRYKAGKRSDLDKLSVRRLQKMKKINLWYDEWKPGEMEQLFRALEMEILPDLREISGLTGYNYQSVEHGLLAR